MVKLYAKTGRGKRAGFAVTALAALCLAYCWNSASLESAETTKAGSPGHFKSGGERSEIVLNEISETLKRMDARLANIEAAALARGAARP